MKTIKTGCIVDMVIVAVGAIIFLWLLYGCTALNQRSQNVEVLYHRDGCLMIVDGLAVETLSMQEKAWMFDTDCKISVKTITSD